MRRTAIDTADTTPTTAPSPGTGSEPADPRRAPQGPSFSVQGNHISWHNWSFILGFNYRYQLGGPWVGDRLKGVC